MHWGIGLGLYDRFNQAMACWTDNMSKSLKLWQLSKCSQNYRVTAGTKLHVSVGDTEGAKCLF